MVFRIPKKFQFEQLLLSQENPNTKIAYISQYGQKIRFLENSIFSERCIALCWNFQDILGTMRHIYTKIFRSEFACLHGEAVGGFWDFLGFFGIWNLKKSAFPPLAVYLRIVYGEKYVRLWSMYTISVLLGIRSCTSAYGALNIRPGYQTFLDFVDFFIVSFNSLTHLEAFWRVQGKTNFLRV